MVSSQPLEALLAALDRAQQEPEIPQLVVLHGESGLGKTYWAQRLFDVLAERDPGYWPPQLVPQWPPRMVQEVNRLITVEGVEAGDLGRRVAPRLRVEVFR